MSVLYIYIFKIKCEIRTANTKVKSRIIKYKIYMQSRLAAEISEKVRTPNGWVLLSKWLEIACWALNQLFITVASSAGAERKWILHFSLFNKLILVTSSFRVENSRGIWKGKTACHSLFQTMGRVESNSRMISSNMQKDKICWY